MLVLCMMLCSTNCEVIKISLMSVATISKVQLINLTILGFHYSISLALSKNLFILQSPTIIDISTTVCKSGFVVSKRISSELVSISLADVCTAA